MSSNVQTPFGSVPDGAIDRLRRELGLTTGDEETNATGSEMLGSVEETLGSEAPAGVAADRVRSDLDELLLALVAVREGGTHGKGLIEGLEELFDASLSPGTVYPHLHDLADEGVLSTHELVRCKEYRLEDDGHAGDRVAEAARQHLALGLFLHAAAGEIDET